MASSGSVQETIGYLAGAPVTDDGLQFCRFALSAFATLFFYDTLITLDLEVQLMWSRPSFNLLSILYILNRYIGFIIFLIVTFGFPGFHYGTLSDAYCKIPMEYIGVWLAYFSWTGIMTVRTCAIYRQKTKLVVAVRSLWAASMTGVFVSLFLSYREAGPRGSDPETGMCLITTIPSSIKAVPIGPAVYEIITHIVTILKSFTFSDDASDTTLPLLYRVLAREGTVYFAASMLMTLIFMIYWWLFTGTSVFILLMAYWAIMSPAMARLVLRLKSAHHVNLSEQSTTDGVTASIPFFRVHGQPSPRVYQSTRFSTAKSSMVEPMYPVQRVNQSEDEAWNGQAFHVLRTMSAIPLRPLEGPKRGSL